MFKLEAKNKTKKKITKRKKRKENRLVEKLVEIPICTKEQLDEAQKCVLTSQIRDLFHSYYYVRFDVVVEKKFFDGDWDRLT